MPIQTGSAPGSPVRIRKTAKVVADAAEQGDSLYEVRKKVYPRSVTGLFANWRWALVWITQLIFYGFCWLPWNGRQAVLLHLVERKFYIFGWIFWPQDVFFLAVLLIISAYSLFLFTAVAGRLWCGYACPQTVYTEVFTWIEQKIEGDRNKRMKLDAEPMGPRKFALKAAKFGAWIFCGFLDRGDLRGLLLANQGAAGESRVVLAWRVGVFLDRFLRWLHVSDGRSDAGASV